MHKKQDISVVVMTSTHPRHRFFVNTLNQFFDVRGVVSEEKLTISLGDTKKENTIISKHLRQRDQSEKVFFGSEQKFSVNDENVLCIERGRSNDPDVFKWVTVRNPRYLILFGTSIIKSPLLSYYDNRIINIHLGLSPYYRGAGTNFWPLVDNLPECVGATIHLAVLRVDAGHILLQVRPDIGLGDNAHDLGNKTIIKGVEGMVQAVSLYNSGELQPVPQRLNIGKVYRKKDFNAQAVSSMLKNFEDGMLNRYLENKNKRDSHYPIVSI